jgi:hypothetical protein
MAITRAQQVRQMLEDGGMLVQPSMTGKRPGYRGEAAAASDAAGGRDAGRSDTGSASGRGDGPSGGGNGGGDDRRERFMGLQGKTGKVEGVQRNTGLEQNRLSNIMKMDRFKTFKPEVKTPPLGLLSFLKGPLQGLSNFTTTKNRAFFEDVIRAGKIPGLNFATVSEMTDEELEKEYQDYMSARLSGETDAYGNPNPGFGKDDGPDPIIPLITTTDDTEDNTEDDPTNIFAKAGITPRIAGSLFAADGGRIGAMEGGIMDIARQEMFLGGIAKGLKKAVKGVSRAVKKVAKSPIGKAAILGAIGYGLGGGTFFQKALPGVGTGGGFSFKNILPNLMGVKETGGVGVGFEGILGKLGLTKGFGSAMPTVTGGITLASILPLLVGKTEEEKKNILDEYYASQKLEPSQSVRGVGSEMDFYKYNLPVTAADGGRIGYQEGSKEPVAKKTMPLLDMGGKEMDLREDGGFVPIGRMEKADDVPARLSKNEFVFTADAVRNAGDGNVDKGAEVMYNMMKNLESGGDVSEESQGLSGAREMFQTSKRLEEVL